ncbi:AbrB/MazE/SpoVT family DNA-binding domain-containing protein [Candidatus Woesearchaeota archaeon]|nr:AbrB/MazE/SpoVT family DNA-binding domain-containing protein [Candidatus Woesearchaeota archaeon]
MICCKTKQWGNSLGVIIPKEVVKEMNIKPNEEVCLDINKKGTNVLKELFGALPFKKATKQLLKESREELESKHI